MQRSALIVLVAGLLLTGASTAQDAGILEATTKNMGDVKSIQFSGSGAQFALGQGVSTDVPGPRVELMRITRTVDYARAASRNDVVTAANPAATQSQFVAGDKAWNVTGTNTTPSAPAAASERQLQIWLTPHGFLKGAIANNGKIKKRGNLSLVTFTASGKYTVTGTISADRLVQKVETWFDNPVLGDMHIEAIYSDYRDFNGIKFPSKVMQRQGGFTVLEVTVADAKPNVVLEAAVPEAVSNAPRPVVQVTSEKLSDRVWLIAGGSHHSVLAEFSDHVTVIEAPQNEDRSIAVIAEVKKLIPSKPIRYLINTHYHFDHSGGLRAYVAEGATIITHESNRAFYEKSLRAPRTLNPDRQAQAKRKVRFMPVGVTYKLSDATQTIDMHHIQGNPHNGGMLMLYLPKGKWLVQVDAYTPLAANASPPATPNPNVVNLYENIQRLNLDVGDVVPLHGRRVPLAELKRTIGK